MAGLLESSNTLSRWKRDQRAWAEEPVPGSKCIPQCAYRGLPKGRLEATSTRWNITESCTEKTKRIPLPIENTFKNTREFTGREWWGEFYRIHVG